MLCFRIDKYDRLYGEVQNLDKVVSFHPRVLFRIFAVVVLVKDYRPPFSIALQ